MKCPMSEKADSGLSVGTIWPAPLTCTYHRLPETLAQPSTSPYCLQTLFLVFFHFLMPDQVSEFRYCSTPALLTTTSFWPLQMSTLRSMSRLATSQAQLREISAEKASQIWGLLERQSTVTPNYFLLLLRNVTNDLSTPSQLRKLYIEMLPMYCSVVVLLSVIKLKQRVASSSLSSKMYDMQLVWYHVQVSLNLQSTTPTDHKQESQQLTWLTGSVHPSPMATPASLTPVAFLKVELAMILRARFGMQCPAKDSPARYSSLFLSEGNSMQKLYRKLRRWLVAVQVLDTCCLPVLSPQQENPALSGESTQSRCPSIFQGWLNPLTLPFSTLTGPTSVNAPNCDPLPGPPCSHTIRGAFSCGSITLWSRAPKSVQNIPVVFLGWNQSISWYPEQDWKCRELRLSCPAKNLVVLVQHTHRGTSRGSSRADRPVIEKVRLLYIQGWHSRRKI